MNEATTPHTAPRVISGLRVREAGNGTYIGLTAYQGWTDVRVELGIREVRLTPAEARVFARQLQKLARLVEENLK